MKSFKILIAAAAVTAVLFSGCQKEVFTGIDKSKAGVTDFTYDEIMSSPSTVSLVWNPSAAKTAGATSFSVQLAKKEDFSDVDMYEPSIRQLWPMPPLMTAWCSPDLRSTIFTMPA